jgi:hypothetical protein
MIVIVEADAAEKPCCVRINSSDTEMNPWLIPDGRTRNRNVTGFVKFRLYGILRYSVIFPVQPSGCTESSTI